MKSLLALQLKPVTIKPAPVPVVLKTNEDMLAALVQLRQAFIDDHDRLGSGLNYDVEFRFGKKYIKILITQHGGQACVSGFVVNVHDHKKYPYGTLLKGAGCNGPELNFARGDIFKLNPKKIRWTGIQ